MAQAKLVEFYEALMSFLALSKQQIFAIAAEYGLTGMQTFMLMLMKEDEPKAMNSFCDTLGCDASNITGLVDGLERIELVSRSVHPHDRRVKVLRLMPKGLAIRRAITQRMADSNQSYILSKLSSEELEQFISLIQKITAGCPAVNSAHAKPVVNT
jgi:DNA-binding MarR family transcriptional regulator